MNLGGGEISPFEVRREGLEQELRFGQLIGNMRLFGRELQLQVADEFGH
jgi:hypothetical protein